MKDRKNQDENFVRAAIISTEKTLIPNSRQYIETGLIKSIDLQFIKNLILSTYTNKLNFYIDNFFTPNLKKDNKLEKNIQVLEKLSEQGVFTRILLQELNDYGLKFYPNLSNKNNFKESKNFFKMLEELAKKEHSIDINPNYIGENIKVSIVLIGRPEKVFQTYGIDISPYLVWILSWEQKGIKNVYLLAWSLNVIAAKRLSE